eukprot:CAMPEP_0179281722 /NCGR_PEP_ID=MMETSP0797-20121207/37302_1 /TAXON_ID=47934 /ORGANISM="Dinophysis acuminata, Strain DAEP01" /LENGTH=346 /DNA_ID=CAMNT_0020990443 /DNA_START=63 /DNA_END=1100 /DNA_ORIENTATION=+
MPKKGAKLQQAKPAAAAPPAAAGEAKTWLDDLSAEDRKFAMAVGCTCRAELDQQKARKEQNAKKAAEAQKTQLWQNEKNKQWEKEAEKKVKAKQREDRQWDQHFVKVLEQARREGVLESEDWGDGLWWVKIGDMYKEVQGQFFCTLCEKHLNEGTLGSHLASEAHQKKVAWNTPDPGASSSSSVPPPAAWASPKAKAASWAWAPQTPVALEEWQEMTADGYLRCIPCGKVIDPGHVCSDAHRNRLECWLHAQETVKKGYPPPDLPYLAWVPADESDPNSAKWMRCLLCKKWAQDDWSHSDSQSSSKEHAKNLRNYSWYKDEVDKERAKWHPPPRRQAPAAAPSPAP